jgi:hypothetical protein
MKSRRPLSLALSVLAALAVAMPMAARDASAKNAKATTTTMDILSAATLGGKQVEPGTYTIEADESTVTFLHNGKIVAQAPAQWKDETRKPSTSNIVTENNQIKEIHFGGKMRYVEVAE